MKDTIPTTKTLQPVEKIIESIMNLRDEFYEAHKEEIYSAEAMAKLNSCLYDEYPPKDTKSE